MTERWADEEPEQLDDEIAGTAASSEAFAATVAARLAGDDPEVARRTADFLSEQAQLLKAQREQLKDEHALRVARLDAQKRESKLRRIGIWIRIIFQLFAATVVALIGAGVILLLHDAFTARSVVVEPFETAPALAARGVTGKVVASALLDELVRLQSATRADAAKRDLSNAWTNEIKLEVPETGISVGEMSRILRNRFGHDRHIDGELVQSDAGSLELTVRGDAIAARTFAGAPAELGKITTAAAEYVYAESEPVLWAYYLTNRGRNDEAIAFSKSAFSGADKGDRPYLLNTWANALVSSGGSIREALALYRAALKLKPDYWVAHNNVMLALWALGDEEGAWRAGEEMRLVAGGRPGRASETYYQNVDPLTWNLSGWLNGVVADAEATGGSGSSAGTAGDQIADIQVRLHDLAAAELALQTTRPTPQDPLSPAMSHFVHGRLAAEAGDTERAVSELETFGVAHGAPFVAYNLPGYTCWIARAEEAAGHPDKADAVLNSAGSFVDCYRFRGDILDGRGDWAGAVKAYMAAVALAPDLPAGYYSWGVALARHGDLTGAEERLKEANKRGPHWADPLKASGDVLSKQGKRNEALAKYDEALAYAPSWTALREARETAAKHLE